MFGHLFFSSLCYFFFFKQKTAYELRISDWSSDVCSSDLFQPDDGGAPVTIRLQRNAAGNRTVSSPSGHPDPEGFLTTLREAFALLDYRNFARFIEDSPLERGRTFSALLGLSAYSDRRQAMQIGRAHV